MIVFDLDSVESNLIICLRNPTDYTMIPVTHPMMSSLESRFLLWLWIITETAAEINLIKHADSMTHLSVAVFHEEGGQQGKNSLGLFTVKSICLLSASSHDDQDHEEGSNCCPRIPPYIGSSSTLVTKPLVGKSVTKLKSNSPPPPHSWSVHLHRATVPMSED